MSQEIVESLCKSEGSQTKTDSANLIFCVTTVIVMQVEFEKDANISYLTQTCDLFMPMPVIKILYPI